MSKSICTYYEQYEILDESILDFFKDSKFISHIDLAAKKQLDKYKQAINNLEKQLSPHINLDIIHKIISKNTKQLISQIKSNNNPKEITPLVFKSLVNTSKEVKETISLPTAIFKSIVLVLTLLLINTFFVNFLILLTGDPGIGLFLASVFIAPIVEEYSKYISIKGDYTKTFFVIFNIFEFTLYVSRFFGIISLGPLLLMRFLAVLLHLITTYVQYKFNKEEENSKTGLAAGIMIHTFWNMGFGALIYSIIRQLL